MKIGKIILLVLGILLIGLGVKGLADLPAQQAALEAAVYLDAPVVLPENEGKRVILSGEPEMTAPVYDWDLGLTINSIKAYRYKETYKKTSNTNEEQKWEWVTGEQISLVGQAKIGEFELDAAFLKSFPAESDYVDFDPEEARDYVLAYKSQATGEVCVLPDGGYYADSQLTSRYDSYFNWLGANIVGQQLEGKTAYRYKYYAPEKNGPFTLAGIQQGNRLVADDAIGVQVHSGIKTADQLLSSNKGGLIGGAVVFLVLGAGLGFLALRKPGAKKA